MEESRKNTQLMLDVIEKMTEMELESGAVGGAILTSEVQQSVPLSVKQEPIEIPKPIIQDTPQRMTLALYEKSPFVKHKKPIKLEFLDFEAEITERDFAKIPG